MRRFPQGIGTANIESTSGARPLAVARITSTSACGTVGLADVEAGCAEVGESDENRVRAGGECITRVTLRLTLRDRSGNTKSRIERTFPADTLQQSSASDLLGVAVAANDSVLVEVTNGTAIVYASTTDNSSQDPSIQIARPR